MKTPARPDAAARLGAAPLLLALPFLAAGGGAASGPGADAGSASFQAADGVAFVNVVVIPMDSERMLTGQTVVVSGDRIVEIGPAGDVDVPGGITTIDGEGRWLLPGVGEMHAHVPAGPAAEEVLFLYLSQGITTARGMLGQPGHIELRERILAGEVLGPRLYTTGPSLNGNSIPSPDSAVRAVRHQKAMGYDLMKIHPGMSRESYDAMVETAVELDIPWAGHVPADVGLERALAAGQASIDHLDLYMEAVVEPGTDVSQSVFFGLNLAAFADDERMAEIARATAEAGVWNVPTQSLIENMASPMAPEEIASWPSMRYMSPETVRGWVAAKTNFMEAPVYSETAMRLAIDARRRIIKALSDAGAGILLGSDAPQVFQVPGFSIQHEMELLVESGLTPYETLRAGTYNVAVYFEALDEFGTIEEGKIADLILLEANPLDDIDNMTRRAGVMARGRWLPASEIETRLEEIAARHAAGE